MKKIVMLSCLVGIVASCTTDENLLVKEESASENLLGQTIVLKERDPKYPLEFPERKTRGLVTPYVVSSEADYLGCSYKLDVFPLGTAENVGCQIIDMEKLKEAFAAVNANITVEVNMSDSTTGMTDAASGNCDIGMASRALKDSELSSGLTGTQIALDGIAVIVNPENPLTSLSSEQVKSIYVGDATVWADVMA